MSKESLYDVFLNYSYEDLIDMFMNAKSKDEQDFYMKLADIVLQREQRKVIGE